MSGKSKATVRVMFSGIINFAPNEDRTKWGVYVPDLTSLTGDMKHHALLVVDSARVQPNPAPGETLHSFVLTPGTSLTFGDQGGGVSPTSFLLNEYLLDLRNAKGPNDPGNSSTFNPKSATWALHATLESGALQECWIDDYLWTWKSGKGHFLAEEICLAFAIPTDDYQLTLNGTTYTLSPSESGEIEIRIVNIPEDSRFRKRTRPDPEYDHHAELYYEFSTKPIGDKKPLKGTKPKNKKPMHGNHSHTIGGMTKVPIPTTTNSGGVETRNVGGMNCPPGGWNQGGP